MRIIIITLALIGAVIFTAKASDDKPITFEQLPQQAQQFVKTYFSERTISIVKADSDMLDKSYDVIFNNGDNLEFDKKGLWTSIECRGSALPAAVVPAQILDYVKKNYPDTEIRKIDKEDRGGYEVELSNNMELKFNSSYKLVDIDM